MEFLEQRNRVKVGVQLSEQWKIVKMRHAEREGRPSVNRPYPTAEAAALAACAQKRPGEVEIHCHY